MDKKVKIKVKSSAFDVNQQRSLLSDQIEPFNQEIDEMNRFVEILDRYDDFGKLKIDAKKYRYSDETGYGIPVRQGFNSGVIFTHQKEAALKFLQELRGFGLLADVVGSGKTFEAGVVLSELAARDKVRSLLIVAPKQVYANWIEVMEEKFGLGKGVLQEIKGKVDISALECTSAGEFLRPASPLIVTMEDFVTWEEDAKRLLFDVIVVDEAHNLCEEEGSNAKAMKLLSHMMQTKKAANMTYCLLLSATPHSGNLEKMFRLWYFIRCKGGNPVDFEEKDDKFRTAEYLREKKYYKDFVCHGATTVMEFIRRVTLEQVCNESAFRAYLQIKGIRNFDALTDGEKYLIVNEFFDADADDSFRIRNAVLCEEIDKLHTRVDEAVAGAYHDGVLRSIMIRQPHDALLKKRQVVNYLFLPVEGEVGVLRTEGLHGEPVQIDLRDPHGDKAVTVGGKKKSLKDYIEDEREDLSYKAAYAEMIGSKILNAPAIKDSGVFTKEGSGQYYWTQLGNVPQDVECKIVPIRHDPQDDFTYKLEKAKEIMREHKDAHILVFFDYDLRRAPETIARFIKELKKSDEFARRIMLSTEGNKESVEKTFNEKKAAILIVQDASFTEGANLQKSHIIINFQVTPDPLAMDQRIGRIFRIGQEKDVIIYSLADLHKLEGYVLMYFSRIGLMSSNGGDATIIAGSNSERMVAVRCNVCGRTDLYSLEDYNRKKAANDLYCTTGQACIDNGRDTGHGDRGTPMEEISSYNFSCSVCGAAFTRSVSEEGYLCMSRNNDSKGIMCNRGESGDRAVYCKKICAIAHCRKFRGKENQCKALRAYRENRYIDESDLMLLCETCNAPLCSGKRCRIDAFETAIASCSTCDEATCNPKPHVIRFDDKWEATCPVCKAEGTRSGGKIGKIRPIVARTFATYIRSAWNFRHDGGRRFCENLTKEAAKVAGIKSILELDKDNRRR